MEKDELRYWDNEGESLDRYTSVWPNGDYIAMNAAPYWPQGFCQHGDGCDFDPDCWLEGGELYSYLGKMITFDDLPKDCQEVIEKELNEEDIT